MPRSIYAQTWDSTFADTVLLLAAPFNPDTIAQLFGVTRRADGGYWYDFEGRGGEPNGGADSVLVGRWKVIAGQYQMMSYTDDIDVPADSSGRIAPEHWRQSWFFGFAPFGSDCAVVVAWRSAPVGSYRGPRYATWEIAPESLQAFFERVQWRDSSPR